MSKDDLNILYDSSKRRLIKLHILSLRRENGLKYIADSDTYLLP